MGGAGPQNFLDSLTFPSAGLSSLADTLISTFDLSSGAIADYWADALAVLAANGEDWTQADWDGMTQVSQGCVT